MWTYECHDDADDGSNADDGANDFVDEKDFLHIEPGSDFVDEVGEQKPPQKCADKNRNVPHGLLYEMVGHDKCETSKQGHEQKYNQRIG